MDRPRPSHYPLLLDLRDRSVAVIGGGQVAERKVAALLSAQARIRLISPRVTARLKALARKGRVQWRPRPFRKGDLSGAFLVFAATNDLQVNRRVASLAVQAGRLVNVAKPPEDSTFLVPAVLRRGDLVISISTGGRSPALAKWVRRELEKTFGREYSRIVRFLAGVRQGIIREIPEESRRRQVLNQIVDARILELVRSGRTAQAGREVRKMAGSAGPIGRYTSRSRIGRAKRSASQKNS